MTAAEILEDRIGALSHLAVDLHLRFVRREGLLEDESILDCPLCGGDLVATPRGRRITFAGVEPPCIEYACHDCGTVGETDLHPARDVAPLY